MFNKILIANRGEIACRVIATARAMGIKTVAVYSDADVHALHVKAADEAVHIGPAPAAQSYLVIENIIEACKKTGAQAVHPGYGFLAENALFAKALKKAGIVFIGPDVKAIETMGDKIESKKLAARAGISTVPGHQGEIKTAAQASKAADRLGYPVMIKASAGGGGKGMRIARNKIDLAEGLKSARSEAKSSFGDDRVLIEKFIEHSRHIEIQILADAHGRIIHLGERECSIQRRNQKVIEEAPSPFLDEDTRQAMCAQAVALAKAVNYRSAGTVEFIVDIDKNFYFLEMNTRLQVEHPVTELTTGIDLVEQMIRIAAGEKLALKQDQIRFDGWAIEARVYAEDPLRNFMPSTGRLTRYRPPAQGVEDGLTIRNDGGVYEGAEIPVYYDPLIGKLCAHAASREAAIDHLGQALDEFVIEGVETNLLFLSAVMAHARWRTGDFSTSFVDREYPGGFALAPLDSGQLKIFASVAAALDHVENARKRLITGQAPGPRVIFTTDRVVWLGEGEQVRKIPVRIHDDGGRLLRIAHSGDERGGDGDCVVESAWSPGQPLWRGRLDGGMINVKVRSVLNGMRLTHGGQDVAARVYTARESELAALMPLKQAPDQSRYLLCPMPGLLVSIAVKPGQMVKAGDPLCVVEAMKMENILRAGHDGCVQKINHQPGASLAVDDVIMEFE